MKKLLLLLALPAIVSCTSETKNSKDNADSNGVSKTEQADVDSSLIWTYSSNVDKMTSKTKYYADISSTNKIDFDFPYEGGSKGGIMLSHTKGGSDGVLLSISKGQFVCDISDGCTVKVRFDQDPAIDFSASAPTDGSSEFLFLQPAKKFILNAKKAKKMIIQAEFYESGLREMEFDVAGLKWDY